MKPAPFKEILQELRGFKTPTNVVKIETKDKLEYYYCGLCFNITYERTKYQLAIYIGKNTIAPIYSTQSTKLIADEVKRLILTCKNGLELGKRLKENT